MQMEKENESIKRDIKAIAIKLTLAILIVVLLVAMMTVVSNITNSENSSPVAYKDEMNISETSTTTLNITKQDDKTKKGLNDAQFDLMPVEENIIDNIEKAPEKLYKITVNYWYEQIGGDVAKESYEGYYAMGDTFEHTPPQIEHAYTNNGNISEIVDGDKEYNIIYYHLYKLTIRYWYGAVGGAVAKPDYIEWYRAGTPYNVPAPRIDGYTSLLVRVTGTMDTRDIVYDVVYTFIDYTLTINYVYEDGTVVAPTYTKTLHIGDGYSVSSPVVEGYTATPAVISGTMPGRNMTYTVIYVLDDSEIFSDSVKLENKSVEIANLSNFNNGVEMTNLSNFNNGVEITNLSNSNNSMEIMNLSNLNNEIKNIAEDLRISKYYFEKQDGVYKSSNKGKGISEARSYIPIDLTSYNTQVTLAIDVEISSSQNDHGYVKLTEKEEVPTNDESCTTLIDISGQEKQQSKNIKLDPKKIYYLIFEYEKKSAEGEGEDTFTINSVKIIKNVEGVEDKSTVTTENEGKASTEIPYGIYKITEIKAPNKYKQLQYPIIIEIYENGNRIIENNNTDVNIYFSETGELIVENKTTRVTEIHDNIIKEGTEIITAKGDKITYTIRYTAEINDYEGNAKITITDYLPYEIDTENTNMDAISESGGIYETSSDEEGNSIYTITWTENRQGINTDEEMNGYTITIDKTIEVAFKNIDLQGKKFVNMVKGKIYLEDIQQEHEVEETCETKTDFTTNIKITKTWEHGNSKFEKPKSITLRVKNGEQVIESYTVTEQDNWTHTFTGLPKYNAETGEEIQYTVDEQAVEGESLEYYRQKIES